MRRLTLLTLTATAGTGDELLELVAGATLQTGRTWRVHAVEVKGAGPHGGPKLYTGAPIADALQVVPRCVTLKALSGSAAVNAGGRATPRLVPPVSPGVYDVSEGIVTSARGTAVRLVCLPRGAAAPAPDSAPPSSAEVGILPDTATASAAVGTSGIARAEFARAAVSGGLARGVVPEEADVYAYIGGGVVGEVPVVTVGLTRLGGGWDAVEHVDDEGAVRVRYYPPGLVTLQAPLGTIDGWMYVVATGVYTVTLVLEPLEVA